MKVFRIQDGILNGQDSGTKEDNITKATFEILIANETMLVIRTLRSQDNILGWREKGR